MPHRATRPGLRWVLLPHPSQFSFVVAKYLNCAHTNKHIRAFAHVLTPTRLLGMRTSAMNSVFGTRLFPHVGQPLPPHLNPLFTHFNYFLTGLFSSCNQKKKPTFFSFLSGNKNKPNGKTIFFIYFFFSNSRHNVYQYSHLSVCLHSKVQCANITSHKLLDCLLVRHSPQLTSLLSVL